MQYGVPELFRAPQAVQEMTERAKEDSAGVAHRSSDEVFDEAFLLALVTLRSILRSADASRRLLIAPDILETTPGAFGAAIASSSTMVLMPVVCV